jgi:DNA polymerase III alpha subunit (gram-positive type)
MRLAIIDIESSGLDPTQHEILEIGLVLIDKDTCTILDVMDQKITPEFPERADPKALFVNGYTKEEWKGSISLHQALLILSEKVQGAIMMSYVIGFDSSFLDTAYRSTGLQNPLHYHRLDLLTMAWMKIPHNKMQSWSLKTVCSYLNIPPENKVHRAMAGTMCAYEVFRRLQEMK